MEPFFSVVMSAIFLGDKPTLPVVLTLLPIVGGVACASLSEASFNWYGFSAAMLSNVTFQSRNVLSKKFMNKKTMDNINLFSVITILAFVLLAPLAVLKEGVRFTPAAMQAMGIVEYQMVMQKTLIAGAFFHMYQQVCCGGGGVVVYLGAYCTTRHPVHTTPIHPTPCTPQPLTQPLCNPPPPLRYPT